MATHEEIRQQAHRLWLEEGKPDGKASEHWARAASMLEASQSAQDKLATLAKASGVSKAVAAEKKPSARKPAASKSAGSRAKA